MMFALRAGLVKRPDVMFVVVGSLRQRASMNAAAHARTNGTFGVVLTPPEPPPLPGLRGFGGRLA